MSVTGSRSVPQLVAMQPGPHPLCVVMAERSFDKKARSVVSQVCIDMFFHVYLSEV